MEHDPAQVPPRGPALPIFVVQHHRATADHYDFRLEIDGVLASWAVPKGPSTDPSVRRLARRVGDHDLAHAAVEGAHGDRNVVQVWDRGTFGTTGSGATDGLAGGHLSFVLTGEKLSGGWSLIRTGPAPSDLWLLIKKRDGTPDDNPVANRATSVLTGRTMDEIAADG